MHDKDKPLVEFTPYKPPDDQVIKPKGKLIVPGENQRAQVYWTPQQVEEVVSRMFHEMVKQFTWVDNFELVKAGSGPPIFQTPFGTARFLGITKLASTKTVNDKGTDAGVTLQIPVRDRYSLTLAELPGLASDTAASVAFTFSVLADRLIRWSKVDGTGLVGSVEELDAMGSTPKSVYGNAQFEVPGHPGVHQTVHRAIWPADGTPVR
jgi:hypothetical protein